MQGNDSQTLQNKQEPIQATGSTTGFVPPINQNLSDVPPMPISQPPATTQPLVNTSPAPANPQSSDFFPPPGSTTPRKKFGSGKIIATFLGILLLVGGITTGILLILEPQLFNQQAAVDYSTLKICENGLYCSLSQPDGGSMCNALNGAHPYCCSRGNYIYNGVCVPNTVCGGVLKADAPTCTTGTLVCKNNTWTCGTACTEGNLGTTCTDGCPAGKAAYLYRRSDCTTYCNVGTNAANCTLDIVAPTCTDVNGNTLPAPSLLCTSLSGTSCTNYKSCSLSKGYDACDPIPGTNQCRYEVNGTVCTGACPGNMPPGYARCQCNNGVWTIGQIPAGGSCAQLCACTGNNCTTCTPPPKTNPPSTPTPTPTRTPTPTPTRSPSPSPSPTPVPQCNTACTVSSQCPTGLTCSGGFCRNPLCTTKANCVCPTASPSPSPTSSPGPTAVCSALKAYDTNWNILTASGLSNLKAGNSVYFCVNGTTSGEYFDKAMFTINSVQQTETTTKRPSTNDYCQLYEIPAGVYSFNVTAKIHHVSLGWVGP